jgi:hypothetical protein
MTASLGREGHACPFCRSIKEPVRVHGHEQCPDCGINILPCCDGGDVSSGLGETIPVSSHEGD